MNARVQREDYRAGLTPHILESVYGKKGSSPRQPLDYFKQRSSNSAPNHMRTRIMLYNAHLKRVENERKCQVEEK